MTTDYVPAKHARLSPSSAHRWITCTRSVQLSERRPPSDYVSDASAEGTAAHAVAADVAGKRFQVKADPHDVTDYDLDDMTPHIDTYIGVLASLMAEHENPELHLEVKVDPLVPSSYGTADAVITSSELVDVVDFKYGRGVPVSAVDNAQLRLYALGALALAPRADVVRMTIVQPRVANGITSETMTTEALRRWRQEIVLPAAHAAIEGNGVFVPTEAGCRFCPAKGICRARADAARRVNLDPPGGLTADELAQAAALADDVADWAKDVKEAVKDLLAAGEAVPGWALKPGRTTRRIPDDIVAIGKLRQAGYGAHDVSKLSLLPLAQLDKVTRGALDNILGDAMVRTESAPQLVREGELPDPAVNGVSRVDGLEGLL